MSLNTVYKADPVSDPGEVALDESNLLKVNTNQWQVSPFHYTAAR